MDNIENAAINTLRESISDDIEEVRAVVAAVDMPAKAEAILALRHLEDARMRLAVAKTYLNGDDPFVEK